MEWILFDNIHRSTEEGVKDCVLCINMRNVTDLKYEDKTMKIGYVDGTQDEYECDMSTYLGAVKALNVIQEVQ